MWSVYLQNFSRFIDSCFCVLLLCSALSLLCFLFCLQSGSISVISSPVFFIVFVQQRIKDFTSVCFELIPLANISICVFNPGGPCLGQREGAAASCHRQLLWRWDPRGHDRLWGGKKPTQFIFYSNVRPVKPYLPDLCE